MHFKSVQNAGNDYSESKIIALLTFEHRMQEMESQNSKLGGRRGGEGGGTGLSSVHNQQQVWSHLTPPPQPHPPPLHANLTPIFLTLWPSQYSESVNPSQLLHFVCVILVSSGFNFSKITSVLVIKNCNDSNY